MDAKTHPLESVVVSHLNDFWLSFGTPFKSAPMDEHEDRPIVRVCIGIVDIELQWDCEWSRTGCIMSESFSKRNVCIFQNRVRMDSDVTMGAAPAAPLGMSLVVPFDLYIVWLMNWTHHVPHAVTKKKKHTTKKDCFFMFWTLIFLT